MSVNRIIFASNNQGKIKEVAKLLQAHALEIVPQSTLNISEAEETGLSFVENAILKARHAAQYCDSPVLADDSGIEVDVLNGQPGIYSARYAGENASDADNREKLLAAIADYPDQSCRASYFCAIVLMRSATDPTPVICQGRWSGYLVKQAVGEYGFGYDPIFYVPEYQCTAAELEPSVKSEISHRAQAMQQLLSHYQSID